MTAPFMVQTISGDSAIKINMAITFVREEALLQQQGLPAKAHLIVAISATMPVDTLPLTFKYIPMMVFPKMADSLTTGHTAIDLLKSLHLHTPLYDTSRKSTTLISSQMPTTRTQIKTITAVRF